LSPLVAARRCSPVESEREAAMDQTKKQRGATKAQLEYRVGLLTDETPSVVLRFSEIVGIIFKLSVAVGY
jgi:hypothetical protein